MSMPPTAIGNEGERLVVVADKIMSLLLNMLSLRLLWGYLGRSDFRAQEVGGD